MDHDVIIVGGGIAGLYVGLDRLRKGHRVCILEKYKYVGGRIVTHKKDGYQWEIGAGRIATTHHRVLGLMRYYGLHATPIQSESVLVQPAAVVHNPFEDLVETWMRPLTALGPSVLGLHTLGALLSRVHGPTKAKAFQALFPYWAEIHTLRADLAIPSFLNEFGSSARYVVCAEGYQAITDRMAAEFKALGGHLVTNCAVKDVKKGAVHLTGGEVRTAPTIVLALHADALRELPSIRMPALRHLRMEPLVRMYAVFPPMDPLPHIVDAGRLRQFIPIHVRKGVYMISYTDGDDATYWMKRPSGSVQRLVMADLRKLLPSHTIPDPIQFHVYPWTSGCTYWLPGAYDPAQMSRDSLVVDDGIFACGESLSLRQAWVEGALESADALLAHLPSKASNNQ